MAAGAVGYVLREFPYSSETFIGHEILELERQGEPLRLFSYRRPRAGVAHAWVREIRTAIEYLPDPLPSHASEVLRSHRAARRRSAGAYGRAWRHAFGRAAAERSIDAVRRFAHAGCLAELVADGSVGHLHAHFARGAARLAMLTGMVTGVPFSFTAHARDLYARDVQRGALREQIARAAFVVTVSEDNKRFLEEEAGAPLGKVRVVYNGVDLTTFAPEAGTPREDGLIVGAGRLVEKKGFGYLIEALQMLRERGVDARCEIAGEGPERQRLETQAYVAGVGGAMTFLGELAQEELPALYRRAAVVVLPAVVAGDGNRDALPTVLLEAMACGTPAVSTRLGGIPEIIEDGVNGMLVPPGDGAELARALELLLDDAARRERFGTAGRATAEARFDLKESAAALRRLFAAGVTEDVRAP